MRRGRHTKHFAEDMSSFSVSVGDSSKHRNIDVDSLLREGYEDDDQSVDASVVASINDRATNVRTLLNKGDAAGSVAVAVDNPPFNCNDAALKAKNLETVMSSLSAVRAADIPAVIKSLTPEQVDNLVKYIYAGFAIPSGQYSGHLLLWHEKAIEVGGLGSITRVLTSRKTVN
ncbi:actin like protein 2/3 complex, subunit 5 [Fonticula alba]|uniref:Actin-related protein 2/3 complex subunit 5 n=1 Tax=Fonticula alba TaxID=691883 RepID=A0A058ZHQ4_FONAL|nr:actin like protein 2/3 complex, subunit 5 [Fonticula alba]KCV73027.1 actin like protein 2/3 complex, subunit 5 [Fonticula alba]|eukprot:XP_009492728.1 actin like protein 2/3 complex, subunit 5 [Fonticula alba]